ncbi:PDZ domain-containing protein, partial [Patescibacteria group bacterium]|nr:PDZ domain-containing protein [Patescibacteria group bacterium]
FLIIIILILSMGGGVFGEIIAGSYFVDNFSSFSNFDFSQGKFRDRGIVISNAKNIIVQQDVKIEETINSVSVSLVGIYKKQKLVKSGNIFSSDNFYKISDAIGQGFIITSDGWIVTTLELDKLYTNYVVIAQDKKIYQIDKAVSDASTGFNFIHVAARDLPVKKFVESQNIKKGNLIISVNWLGLSWISSVLGFKENGGFVKPSDNFSTKLILNNDVPEEFRGSVIFNLAGDALGLIDEKGEIEPMAHLKTVIDSLFKNKIIIRPSLGVNYINLTSFVAVDEQNNYWQKGVVIYKDVKNIAVKKNSPADKAGLKEGDIIIAVDNINLDKVNDLADIVQSYAVGDKINLLIMRDGAEKDVEVLF